MNERVVVGVVLLIVGLVYFVFAPVFIISNGTEVVLWVNILPGIVLVALGISLLATRFRSKMETA